MDSYQVEIAETAMNDLLAISDHIAVALQAPLNAEKQMRRLMTAIMALDIFPERYSIVDAEPWRSRGLRHMPVDHYTVFYVILDGRVVVTDVLYSASDLAARLTRRDG